MLRIVRWNRLFAASIVVMSLVFITKRHLWMQTLGLFGQALAAIAILVLIYFFVILPLWGVIKFFLRLPGEQLTETYSDGEPDFYSSRDWKELRYIVLANNPRKCMLCGHRGKSLHVDHIKPRSLHPELALDIDNLQILCGDCNVGKSNKHTHDFRSH